MIFFAERSEQTCFCIRKESARNYQPQQFQFHIRTPFLFVQIYTNTTQQL